MKPVTKAGRARQVNGGPAAEEGVAASAQAASSHIETQIIGLATLGTGELRIEWQRLYCATPPTRLSRDLLLRGIAYRIQEHALGGITSRSSPQRPS